MIEISNRDYSLIIEKLPMVLQSVPKDYTNIRFMEACRQLTQMYKKFLRKKKIVKPLNHNHNDKT